jgi:hypothetical protein
MAQICVTENMHEYVKQKKKRSATEAVNVEVREACVEVATAKDIHGVADDARAVSVPRRGNGADRVHASPRLRV